MNSTSLVEWAMSNQNMALVNVVQQAVALLFSLLIFIKSYDFESCLASVREKRELKRKEKEKAKLLKFQKMLELARANPQLDLTKLVAVSENESVEEESEEKKEEAVLKIAKKKRRNVDSAV
jgi:hypothetical protein